MDIDLIGGPLDGTTIRSMPNDKEFLMAIWYDDGKSDEALPVVYRRVDGLMVFHHIGTVAACDGFGVSE